MKRERDEKDDIVDSEFERAMIQLLSQAYYQLCNCRKNYEELEDFLDPDFHEQGDIAEGIEPCPYYLRISPMEFDFGGDEYE